MRATLANRVIKCGMEYMGLIYEQLHGHLLERDIIHTDETPYYVLKEEGKPAQSKSYMLLYGSGNDGLLPIRLYDYQPSRGGYHVEEFLKGFSGYLTCDGFSGYNKLKNVIRCGCFAHMRRYWHEALPGKSKKSPDKTLAEIGFDYCNQLFKLEKEYAYLEMILLYMLDFKNEPEGIEELMSWPEMIQQR